MKKERLIQLNTEQQNLDTMDIDSCSTREILEKINNEDQKVPVIIRKKLEEITKIVEHAYVTVKKGGRVFYVGAGTSGRIGILDASECPPTYGVSKELFQGIIAGGNGAIFEAKEGAEDSKEGAAVDLKNKNISDRDIVIGMAASGRTPYVIGALEYAKKVGAKTCSISCVENAEISKIADRSVEIVTGPEVVTGSTRMKAGTAQKLVCNMISTAVMIKCGKVFNNLMVDVQPTNQKLEARACHMIQIITGLSDKECYELYMESNKNVKVAIVMNFKELSYKEAQDILNMNDGNISKVLRG